VSTLGQFCSSCVMWINSSLDSLKCDIILEQNQSCQNQWLLEEVIESSYSATCWCHIHL
jgi:hypothetical protein